MKAKRQPSPRIELWQAGNGRWYFHKRNRNGRTTDPSQGYTTKWGAKRAAKKAAGDLPVIELTAGLKSSPPS